MKFRNQSKAEKIEPQMAPMIDVVFQLLIFFMLTLKIVEPEGDFNINMPIGQAAASSAEELKIDIKVRLQANEDGSLAQLSLGPRNLGNDTAAFERLNHEILNIIGRPGTPAAESTEVDIEADYNLDFQHTISAVSACTGRLSKNGQIVRYIEKINLTPPRKP